MNRREFLKKGVLGLPALLLVPAVGGAKEKLPYGDEVYDPDWEKDLNNDPDDPKVWTEQDLPPKSHVYYTTGGPALKEYDVADHLVDLHYSGNRVTNTWLGSVTAGGSSNKIPVEWDKYNGEYIPLKKIPNVGGIKWECQEYMNS